MPEIENDLQSVEKVIFESNRLHETVVTLILGAILTTSIKYAADNLDVQDLD